MDSIFYSFVGQDLQDCIDNSVFITFRKKVMKSNPLSAETAHLEFSTHESCDVSQIVFFPVSSGNREIN